MGQLVFQLASFLVAQWLQQFWPNIHTPHCLEEHGFLPKQKPLHCNWTNLCNVLKAETSNQCGQEQAIGWLVEVLESQWLSRELMLVGLEQWSLRCTLWPMAAVSPGHLLEIQILGPHPRPGESETLGMGSSNLCFYKWFLWKLKFVTYWFRPSVPVHGDWSGVNPIHFPGLSHS